MLDAVADAIAAAASLVVAATGQANAELWVHEVNDQRLPAADPHTVLAVYGGPVVPAASPVSQVSVQAMTRGRSVAEAAEQAEAVFDALFDPANGRPRVEWAVGDYVVHVFSPRPPARLGRDEKQRVMFASNFDLAFRAADD
jgi:hypothetical protein